MLLQHRTDPYRDGPMARTAEEKDLMKKVTLEDIDKEFDDMVPASPGPEHIDNPHWDDPMTIPGQGKQVTGEVTLKGMEKTLDSALQASPVLAETATQDALGDISPLSEALSSVLSEAPSTSNSGRVSRRVRPASLSLSESGSVRRTRSMTATAMSASASPTRIPGPSEAEEPESWESACQADKRMSDTINAGKAARVAALEKPTQKAQEGDRSRVDGLHHTSRDSDEASNDPHLLRARADELDRRESLL